MKLILATTAPKNTGLPYFYSLELKKKLKHEKLVYLSSSYINSKRTLYTRFINRLNLLLNISSNYLFKEILHEIENSEEKINILLFNTSGLNKYHLKSLNKFKNVLVYNYLSDNPLGMSNKELELTVDGFKYMKKVFVFSKSLIPIVYQYGAKEVDCIPFGYCKENHLNIFNQNNQSLNNLIIYFGTWGPLIEEWLYPLKDFNLRIYGNDWSKSKYKELREISSFKNGMQSDMSKKALEARIVINFVRAQHGGLSSMKTFELAASGACVVTNRTQEQLDFFNEEEFCYFDSKDEMVKIVKELIMDENKNLKYRKNSYKRVLNQSYMERADQLLNSLL